MNNIDTKFQPLKDTVEYPCEGHISLQGCPHYTPRYNKFGCHLPNTLHCFYFLFCSGALAVNVSTMVGLRLTGGGAGGRLATRLARRRAAEVYSGKQERVRIQS